MFTTIYIKYIALVFYKEGFNTISLYIILNLKIFFKFNNSVVEKFCC